jgi:hypothetical protein
MMQRSITQTPVHPVQGGTDEPELPLLVAPPGLLLVAEHPALRAIATKAHAIRFERRS